MQFTHSFQLPLVLTNGNLSFRAFGFSQSVSFSADLMLFIKTKEKGKLKNNIIFLNDESVEMLRSSA
jgi:hypothetical protein